MKNLRALLTLAALAASLGLGACGTQPSPEKAAEPGMGNTPVSTPTNNTLSVPAESGEPAQTEGTTAVPAEGAGSTP